MKTGGHVGVVGVWVVTEAVADAVGVWVFAGCAVADALLSGVGDAVDVLVPVYAVGDREGVFAAVDVMLGVRISVPLAIEVGVKDGVAVWVGERVAVGDAGSVLVLLGVLLGIGVSVILLVEVGVKDGVAVTVGVWVTVTVGEAVAVGEMGAKALL